MATEKILIVEDEPAISELIQYNLQKEGYTHVKIVESGEQAIVQSRTFRPDLIFLDLMLPGINGLDVCRKVKSDPETAPIPIIMLTARSEESDIVVGLEIGADDYITKPFSAKLLIARMRAVLRRCQTPGRDGGLESSVLAVGPIRMDLLSRQVWVSDEQVVLTRGEFEALRVMIRLPGRVFTRAQLVQETRGDDYPVTERAIDVQILGLRRKLKGSSELIETIRGVGYRFNN